MGKLREGLVLAEEVEFNFIPEFWNVLSYLEPSGNGDRELLLACDTIIACAQHQNANSLTGRGGQGRA